MQDKDAEIRLLALPSQLLHGRLNILLKLADRILEGGAGIVNLVDNEDVLANQVRHLKRRQVEPLRARHFCAGCLDLGVCAAAELLVEGQPDGLDGDVGRAGLLEEGAEDARGHVTAAADGDHEVGLEVIEDFVGGFLAQLVHLYSRLLLVGGFLGCICGLFQCRGVLEKKRRAGWGYAGCVMRTW